VAPRAADYHGGLLSRRTPTFPRKAIVAFVIRERILGAKQVHARQVANAPWNWRTHPPNQRAAVLGSLTELGNYAALPTRLLDGVNERGEERFEAIDGHLRRELFEAEGVGPETLVWITFADLDEREARKANLLHDPLSAMAGVDRAKLDALLEDVRPQQEDLARVVAALAAAPAPEPPAPPPLPAAPVEDHEANRARFGGQYGVIVVCETEADQEAVYARLTGEGLRCRVVNT